jgi:hypothetical protein
MNGDTTYALNDLLALADRLEAKRHAAPDADADAFRRGDWRTGSRCRDGPGDDVPAVILDNSQPAQGRTEPPYYEPERNPQ